jgi:hypothetical protein
MTAWRRHARFEFANTEGVIRVLRDVIVRRLKNGDIVATGTEPGWVGDEVTVHLIGREGGDARARIVECRPVVVDGFVRHRMRLALVDQVGTAVDNANAPGVRETE